MLQMVAIPTQKDRNVLHIDTNHRAAGDSFSADPPVQEMESTPGPWYSTIAPVPPFTVRIPATFKMTSFGDVQPDRVPVSFTPITLQRMDWEGDRGSKWIQGKNSTCC